MPVASVCGMPQKQEPIAPKLLRNKAEELAQKTEKNREQLVRSEIMLAETFCDLAETELRAGDRDHADKVMDGVRKALKEARSRMVDLDLDDNDCKSMRAQVGEIAERLRQLEKA
jgi:hypothetical protein